MYVVTFYSFKGGVGRTLALANVGLELARTGRKVLLMDFDLEAPGLDTFDRLRPKEPQSGIIEYISDYLATFQSPDVKDYVYEVSSEGRKGGRLWIMPAGKSDEEYSWKLHKLDWHKLYEESDGFLMFEDLKVQLGSCYNPDYILIDSRTGHTDIGGICTRQLPDSVVILFFPNEQNLTGLQSIVSSIRNEKNKKDNESIQMHYVMSNVPDLDDEQEILAGLSQRFKERLGYDSLASVIHKYDSLSLLRQALFVVDRPKSRLAREYRQLAESITLNNVRDRQAVMNNLIRSSSNVRIKVSQKHQRNRIDGILKYHSQDAEILYQLAIDLRNRGSLNESEEFLSRSIDLGHRSPEALLAQGEALSKEGSTELASQLVLEACQTERLDENEIIKAINILQRIKPSMLNEITNTPAFLSLRQDECFWISNSLMGCKDGLKASVELLSRYYKDTNLTVQDSINLRLNYSIALIGLSHFSDALALFGKARPNPQDLGINDCFNYGIAEWGAFGKPHNDMFEQVLYLDKTQNNKCRDDANYCQCIAITLWILDRKQDALDLIEKAIKKATERPISIFSCWRYMQISSVDFQEDCEIIKRAIQGEDIRPMFFAKSNTS